MSFCAGAAIVHNDHFKMTIRCLRKDRLQALVQRLGMIFRRDHDADEGAADDRIMDQILTGIVHHIL